ncbi:reverse transcriptase family protein [Pendulispora albinea]|uniref:RNA-directed DNA polymerase n=1 Tax=Pendulispora albinea TaxID=2741071 RepID=A0ABZ2LTJ0_9BACT
MTESVAATPLVVLDLEKLPAPTADATERARDQRKKRAAARQQDIARWKAIEEAGGNDAWIDGELRQRGLFVDTDPSTLAESEKASFKEKKRVEAVEKRRLAKLAWKAYLATHVSHVGSGVFYCDDNDEPAKERDLRVARAKENGLGDLDSPASLAKALGITVPELRWLAYHREVESASHYRFWTIAKRDGSRRMITAPKPELKAAQRWLLRNVFEKLPVHGAAHGFLSARSIATNAAVHAGARLIVKVDVKDFFPTVTLRRIKGMLRKAGLPENVATLIALVATEPPRDVVQFRGQTLYVAKGPRACPQGAPTSPAITNAICRRLDRRMSGLARMMGFTYSRYADDLAFSYHADTRPPVGQLLHGVHAILASEGFRVHAKKTAVMRSGMSQRVTGLVVNSAARDGVPAARVPRDVVRRLKAAIFNREKGRPPPAGKGEESLAQLKGMAAFVHMTDEKRGRAFLDRIAALEAREGATSSPRTPS